MLVLSPDLVYRQVLHSISLSLCVCVSIRDLCYGLGVRWCCVLHLLMPEEVVKIMQYLFVSSKIIHILCSTK